MGLFESALQPWRITICSEASFLYEHELAHAWEHANLTDAKRMAFMKCAVAAHGPTRMLRGRNAAWRTSRSWFKEALPAFPFP